jgi:hypothetical protein
MKNDTNKTITIDLVAVLKSRTSQKQRRHHRRFEAIQRASRERLEWTLVHSKRRGGYIVRRDLPPHRGGFVGLTSDLQDAEFFDSYEPAARTAYWQSGFATPARRHIKTGRIEGR